MRLISKIYKRLIDIEKSLIGNKMENQITFATIHGILLILIGLSSAYYFVVVFLDKQSLN